MNTFQAIAIAEGSEEADEDTNIEAWQFLIDQGVVWQLQGSFGRTAMDLIRDGICQLPPKRQTDHWGHTIPSRDDLEKGLVRIARR